MKETNRRRLTIAMICYGVLISVALYGLLPVRSSNEAFILLAVLLFFLVLIIKTVKHSEDE